jgi:hypothetical protein
MMTSSIGFVNSNEPIVKMGVNLKLDGYPGAGYPQPDPRWHPSAMGTWVGNVTVDSLLPRLA